MSVPLDRPYYGAPWGVAIARFFGKYATFRGRASRSEYWWWAFTNAIVAIVINVVGQSLGASEWQNIPVGLPVVVGPMGPVTSTPGVIALVYALVTFLPSLALTWRRLHDTDRSGAWFFLVFVPLVGWFVLLLFLIGRSRDDGRAFD